MSDFKLKMKLIYQLLRCEIHDKTDYLSPTSILVSAHDIINDIKVDKKYILAINTFWKKISQSLKNCTGPSDIKNYLRIGYPTKDFDDNKFWRIFEELKALQKEQDLMKILVDIETINRKSKIKINPHYGRHFNKYNKTQ